MFKSEHIDQDLIKLSPLVRSLLPDSEQHDFFARKLDLLDLSELAGQRSIDQAVREDLVSVLRSQYAEIGVKSGAVMDQIQKLSQPSTLTVTTGHQLSLLGGPMFLLNKALGVIKLSQQLNQQWLDKHVVPVFWLASEDHDFEEIATAIFKGEAMRWNQAAGDATGRLSADGLMEIIQAFDQKATRQEVNQILDKALEYLQSGPSLGRFTQWFLHQLLGRLGMVIIDPDDVRLKRHFVPIVEKEIAQGLAFEHISSTNVALHKAGHKVQVTPRKVNLFYFEQNKRLRLDKDVKGWFTVDGESRWTEQELLSHVSESPELFSPNVVMRPMFQETILPNLAYLGGPGELQYWGQLRTAFEAFELPMPSVGLRPRGAVLNQGAVRKVDKLKVELQQLFEYDTDGLKRLLVERDKTVDIDSEIAAIMLQMNKLVDKLAVLDQGLGTSVNSLQGRWKKDLEQLQGKIIKLTKQQNEVQMQRVEAIYGDLFPGGVSQERKMSVLTFIEMYGVGAIDDLLAAFQPFDQDFTLFTAVENS